MQQLLATLNSEQAQAVIAPLSSHILVLAGAGCGKTTVLTNRIAYCIDCGVPQVNILAITFTRKAADEMRSRIKRLKLIDTNRELPLITTFHGFALKVLSEKICGLSNFQRIGFLQAPECISENERLKLLCEISKPEDRKAFGLDIYRLDSLLAKLEVFPETQGTSDGGVLGYCKNIAEEFSKLKKERGVWDFSDLLTGLVKLFSMCPAIALVYVERYTCILVDEFQDTNPKQIDILKHLLGNRNRIFAVGDDDQAIYGFRGADVRPTLEFKSYFQDALLFKLQMNYRSVKQILKIANGIFSEKNAVYRKILVPGTHKEASGKPEVHQFENQVKMISWISVRVRSLIQNECISMENIAILFRTNQTLDLVKEYIDKQMPELSTLQLLTVHKAKGLEFMVVFLCDLEEGVFPSYKAPHQRKIRSISDFFFELLRKKKKIVCDFEEEKRLFYVAVTRAERFLYCMTVKTKDVYGRPRKFKRSRFLKYL